MKKYYLEVIGGKQELYTVKAESLYINDRNYIFYVNTQIIASYPISITIIKSVEEK
jgi:hypothetical protein